MQNFEFNSLNIVSLNVRGLRDSTKRKALFLFCKHTEADRIFLQETDSGETNCKFCKSQWGNSVFFDHGTNHSAGVVILLHKVRGDIIDSVTSSLIDRFLPRVSWGAKTNGIISSLCNQLSVVDAWRFFNDIMQDFTWCNGSKTLRSRIDFFSYVTPSHTLSCSI